MAEDVAEGMSLTKKLRMSRELAADIAEFADGRCITFSAAVRYLCASALRADAGQPSYAVETAPAALRAPEDDERPPMEPAPGLPADGCGDGCDGCPSCWPVAEALPHPPTECDKCGRSSDPVLDTPSLMLNTAKRTWSCLIDTCRATGGY